MATQEELRERYRAAARRRLHREAPAELTESRRAAARLVKLRARLDKAVEDARRHAVEQWADAHPMPNSPRVRWWWSWSSKRQERARRERGRLLSAYEKSPDRLRFVRDAERAAREDVRAAYRDVHGVEIEDAIREAEEARRPYVRWQSEQEAARRAAPEEMRAAVKELYQLIPMVGWIARYLDASESDIRKHLGISELRRASGGRRGGGYGGDFFGGDGGDGGSGGDGGGDSGGDSGGG